MIALGALFITAEYRRGMIRTTFAASPRRGRVLAAKAMVIGSVTFVAGLIGTAIAVLIAERKLNSGGWVSSVFPVWALTSGHGLQIVVGTAALLAIAAILALSAGAVLRRSAGRDHGRDRAAHRPGDPRHDPAPGRPPSGCCG